MRKRLFAFAAVVLLTLSSAWAQQVKYVFYFIGDGMGVNQINVTETYLAALKGKIGFEPITMSSFPVVGMVNTYSATNGVTDSAAGGTALATGKKTKNGVQQIIEIKHRSMAGKSASTIWREGVFREEGGIA